MRNGCAVRDGGVVAVVVLGMGLKMVCLLGPNLMQQSADLPAPLALMANILSMRLPALKVVFSSLLPVVNARQSHQSEVLVVLAV